MASFNRNIFMWACVWIMWVWLSSRQQISVTRFQVDSALWNLKVVGETGKLVYKWTMQVHIFTHVFVQVHVCMNIWSSIDLNIFLASAWPSGLLSWVSVCKCVWACINISVNLNILATVYLHVFVFDLCSIHLCASLGRQKGFSFATFRTQGKSPS